MGGGGAGRVGVVFEVVVVVLGTHLRCVPRGGGSSGDGSGDVFASWWPVMWPRIGLREGGIGV